MNKARKYFLLFLFLNFSFSANVMLGMKQGEQTTTIFSYYFYGTNHNKYDYYHNLIQEMKETYLQAFTPLFGKSEVASRWDFDVKENFPDYEYLFFAREKVSKKIIGFVFFDLHRSDCYNEHKDIARICKLAVHPVFQKKGIGRKLVYAIFEDEDFEHIQNIELMSYPSAKNFYKKIGFVVAKNKNDDHELEMSREKYLSQTYKLAANS